MANFTLVFDVDPRLPDHFSLAVAEHFMDTSSHAQPPMRDMAHAWEEFVVEQVYPEPGGKAKSDYRDYDNPARDSVRRFYEENHREQTYDFVCGKRAEYLPLARDA